MVHTSSMSPVSLRSIAFPLAASALFLFSVPSLSAATLCVNPAGTGGCKSTINAAVTAASPGDTIRVASGIQGRRNHLEVSLARRMGPPKASHRRNWLE